MEIKFILSKNRKTLSLWACIFCFLLLNSCSISKLAINAVSNALTGSGSADVFTGDSDPILVGDALPFAIKMYEALLSQNPKHQGLILTTGSLFVMYANAFVQSPAEMLPVDRYMEKAAELERAKNLFLRGADLLYGGLDLKYPGFIGAYENGTLDSFLAKMKKDDVPYLYWAVAGVLSAFSLDSFNMTLGIRIPELKAMIERAYVLDPDFNNGAIDDFFIIFYSALPANLGGNRDLAFQHFQRAVEKSGGLSASPYVSYAKSVAIPAQDYDTFKEMLETALAINPDADTSNRLVNILSLQKARFLLDNAGAYFISLGSDDWDWDLEGWEWDDEW
ncbi:MAG: TRAP transporter TatT component family protein [Treponema sp.]|jgi:predicted anti-sigma-YlaC factor YlaD|nr:TRAP transporter TatT component family protein [Treponema sp.]